MLRKLIIRNASSSIASRVASIVIALLLTPFLIRCLGKSSYGLWVLVSAFIGYFGLTDFGLRSAVGRFITLHKARNEVDEMNRVVMTSLSLLAASGAVIALATLISSLLFTHIFTVEPEHVQTARQLVVVIGLTFAFSLPLDVFDGVLVGYARYDWINALEIGATVARALSAVSLLWLGFSVLALAWSNLVIQICVAGVKYLLARKLFPELSLAPRFATKAMAGTLYGFSAWAFVMFLHGRLTVQTDNVIVGWGMNTEAVAVYSIAGRLVQYAMMGSAAFSTVLTPMATEFFARGDTQQQHRLFFQATKLSLFYASFMALVFYFYGSALVRLWVGDGFAGTIPVLWVLSIPMIGIIASGSARITLFGMAKHKWMGVIYIVDAVTNVALSIVLVKRWGMIGVAYGTLLSTTFSMALLLPAYACRVLQIKPGDYLRRTYGPALLMAAPLALGLWGLQSLWIPTRLMELAVLLGVTGGAFFGAVYYFHFSRARMRIQP